MDRIDQMGAGLDSHIIYQDDEWGKRDANIKIRPERSSKDNRNRHEGNNRPNMLERE
jgi:hypothetical protein